MNWDGPGPQDRLLVIAPHPDDETLSAGGLLQRTLERGGRASVAFATDGENNPWTQRLVEKRWRVGPQDCARFGRKRREEALAALAVLGVPASEAVFLALPDQRITEILLSDRDAALSPIAALLEGFRPTIVVAPSLEDLHPDHSALAVLLRLGLERAGGNRPRLLNYLIHRRGNGRAEPSPQSSACMTFEPSPAERGRKRRAILCHATQLVVHRRKFLATADRPEIFYPEPELLLMQQEGMTPGHPLHPVRGVRYGPETLRLDIALRPRPGAFGRPTLHMALGDPGDGRSLSFDLRWRRGGADVKDRLTDETKGRASLVGGRRGGIVEVPRQALPDARRIYLKLERRFGFFDEGGWLVVETPPRRDG